MPSTKLERYALLALAAICDAILVAGAVVNQLSPHVAAQWGAIVTLGLGAAHTGLEFVRQNGGPAVITDMSAPAIAAVAGEIEHAIPTFEQWIHPDDLSDRQKGANPPSHPEPPVTPPLAPTAPQASPEDRLRAQLQAAGLTPEA